MNTISDTSQDEKTLAELMGISGEPTPEQEDFLARVGELIMEGVMIRAIAGMTDEEAKAFDAFIATDPSPEALYEHLHRVVPEIDQIFEEESQAFRDECVSLLSRTSVTS